MEFSDFLAETGMRPVDVARETRLHASTIIRIRDKEQRPDGATLLRLNEWAESVRKRKRLPARFRLSWQYLHPEATPGKGAA